MSGLYWVAGALLWSDCTSELGNLVVDCILGGDAIDHMGGVTVRRGSDSKYLVRWG